MCGIAGFIIRDPSASIDREALLDVLLAEIDHRGGDATGFVARNREGMLEWQKASTDVRGFLPHRRRLPVDSDVCLAHTRFATQGDRAFPENNHPVKRGPMFVTHNGVIFNDRQLFAATARTPYGQVDSEAIAALLSHCGMLTARTGEAFKAIDGSAAIAALDERDGTVMLARISSSPLYVLSTRRVLLWASTAKAVTAAHKKVIGNLGRVKPEALAEGEGIILRDGTGTRFEFELAPYHFVASKAWMPKGDETSGCYLPAAGKATGDSSRYLAARGNECEICGEEDPHDLYDLWDGEDIYECCEGCWQTYSDVRDTSRETVDEELGGRYA
jgi:asparagine synthetase B (glutamine-hydrolysing)